MHWPHTPIVDRPCMHIASRDERSESSSFGRTLGGNADSGATISMSHPLVHPFRAMVGNVDIDAPHFTLSRRLGHRRSARRNAFQSAARWLGFGHVAMASDVSKRAIFARYLRASIVDGFRRPGILLRSACCMFALFNLV